MTPYAATTLAADFAELATFVSLHSADPGDSGSSELGVAREPVEWTPDGSVAGKVNASVHYDELTGTWAYVGFWDAATGGNFIHHTAQSDTASGTTYDLTLTYQQG